MRSSALLAVAAFASCVVAALQNPAAKRSPDSTYVAGTDPYVDEAVGKITNFVKDTINKEYPGAIKRSEEQGLTMCDEAAADVDSKHAVEEPVAEVVVVLIEITEIVSKDGKQKRWSWPWSKKEPEKKVEKEDEYEEEWESERKHDKSDKHDKHDKHDKPGKPNKNEPAPSPSAPTEEEKKSFWRKLDFFSLFPEKKALAASRVNPQGLAIITVPVINVQTKTKHGMPTTTTKTKEITTTISLAQPTGEPKKNKLWTKQDFVEHVVHSAEGRLGGVALSSTIGLIVLGFKWVTGHWPW